ncbi:protein NRT1/ PTR FAMILY 1.2-like [Senna tora]|uniref:Protein NRT1/ PTR FAMILY 1.2-like n=1 Tax=Senna tora TaxID=362788 RepID=A0A834XDH9_9FABA|nr:protein NRT1/ PTR FAMILY 1.2-like [Senna tora]
MEMKSRGSSSGRGQMALRKKGGFITMPFIIVNEALAKVASLGLGPNMILYLIRDYRLRIAIATKILLLSSAASNLTPLLAAFLADSYLGRFLSIGLGSIFTFLGMTLMWLTAMIPQARPPPCNHTTESCVPTTTWQFTLLLSCFALMAIGGGGLSCSLAFGADQVNRKDNPNNQRVLEIFFSWYYASTGIAVIIAFTGIVYIQDHFGWKLGFGVPASLSFLSAFFFFVASPLYVKQKPNTSMFTGFVQVMVVSFKNRKLPLPPLNSDGMYHHNKDSDLIAPSDKLRFLNKACIIKDPQEDIASDGSASNPWNLCTAEQVEELKAIIKIIPLWSTNIMMSVNANQGSFPLLQAKSLDRHIIPTSSTFQIPAASLPVIMILTIFLWVALYDRIILPLASKIRGKPVRINAKNRMGIGLCLYFLHLVSAAIVETIRRSKAIKEGHIEDDDQVLDMSVLWLFPQLFMAGIAEAFNAIGQQEFYYSEFPKTMSSIASSLFGVGMAGGNLVATAVFSIVDDVSSRGGTQSWVCDNINKGHYDRYYWILASMGGGNLVYFLWCSWAYGPTSDEASINGGSEGEIVSKEEEFTE